MKWRWPGSKESDEISEDSSISLPANMDGTEDPNEGRVIGPGQEDNISSGDIRESYSEKLQHDLSALFDEKDSYALQIDETREYLQADHGIYKRIKSFSESAYRKIIDREEIGYSESENNFDYILFDFENNEYYADGIAPMKECYLAENGELHICNDNGIYIDYVSYSSSSLFLSGKDVVESDSNYIRAFEKILDYNLQNCDNISKFSLFCMLPEAVDVFNTRIRRCLNTFKGKIISIPKSVAISHHEIDGLAIGERFYVVDLDGLHPIVTQLSIGMDDDGHKIILREGFISNHSIKYDYVTFANEYLLAFQKKYDISFTETENNRLVFSKTISRVFTKHETVSLFRINGRVDVIFDEALYNKCLRKFVTKDCSFADGSKIFVVSCIEGLITGKSVISFNNSISYNGLMLIRNKLLIDSNTIIWKEKLPRISLEVIDDNTGRFSTIDLIDENNVGQEIRLSLDEEVELPFKGTITLQKGKKEYYLPLQREIFSEDINSAKEAYFYDKSLPLNSDVPVELIVKYNYLSESPIKLYARPKIKISAFSEIANIWVDPHEIKAYSGAVYEGHQKEMREPVDDVFTRTTKALIRFVKQCTDLSCFEWEPRGFFNYHKDFKSFNGAYFYLRSSFDPVHIDNEDFIYMYDYNNLDELFRLANQALQCDSGYYGAVNKHAVEKYKLGISHLFSSIVVASWYYDRNDENIKQVYAHIVKEDKIRILAKLSRCIQNREDDYYRVFEKLTTKIKEYFEYKYKEDNKDQRISYIRALSQNCWFSNSWTYQFYNTVNGAEAINLIMSTIWQYLYDCNFKNDKEYRDVMELLVCLSMARNYYESFLNPNDKITKDFLYDIKWSYEEALRQIDNDNLVSRLEMEQDQGVLFGYHNYIYMLIVILSGEGQINLVGYHDD